MHVTDHIRLVILSVFWLGLIYSCQKADLSNPEVQAPKVSVSFQLDENKTKGYVNGLGDNIATLDLVVFRASDGMIDARGHSEGSTYVNASVTASCSVHWYIIANAPYELLSSFTNESSFLAIKTSLADTQPNGMVMMGSGTSVFDKDNKHISAQLNRYACKITFKHITVDWLNTFSSIPNCTLNKVAILNAVGTTPLSGTPTTGTLWYNMSTVDYTLSPQLQSMLIWDDGLHIPDAATYAVDASLYTMPNPHTGNDYAKPGQTWTERRTRVALSLIIDGIENWYPIDLPAMVGNHHYVINNVTIKGPGTIGPDMKIERSDVSFDIHVQEWGEYEQDVDFGT